MKREKPTILKTEVIAKSRLFALERLHLRFANGVEREYERFCTQGCGAVLVVALLDAETVLLVREYAAGLDSYELTFPKGVVDSGESPLEAANRELMEEVGYGARDLRVLTRLATAPGYWNSQLTVVLAQDLYPAQLTGDEPEELEVFTWSLNEFNQLLDRDDFNDARSIAALYRVRDWLRETA